MADVVVVGTVIAVRAKAADASGPERLEVEVRPAFRGGRAFKGSLDQLILATPAGSASCGVTIERGREYVIFASSPDASRLAWFTTCSGSRVYPTRDGDDAAAPFTGTEANRVIPELMELADRTSRAPQQPAQYFTSPACWSQARVTHAGAPAADLRRRVRVMAEPPMPNESGGLLSPNGGYKAWTFAPVAAGNRIHAEVVVSTDRPTRLRLRADSAVDAPGINWVNEKLLFVRVAWSRARFTDLLLDVERGTVIYEEQAAFAREVYEQSRDGCAGQCPCYAVPGSATTLAKPPARPAAPGEDRLFPMLRPGVHGFLDADWDGLIFTEPRGFRVTTSRLKGALGREEYPVDIVSRRLIRGTWWLEVALYTVSKCSDQLVTAVHRGWVPAYSTRGRLVGGYWPRGC